MNNENLMRSVRPIHLLVLQPGQSPSEEPKFWSMQLDGLHQNHLKISTKSLREDRKRPDQPLADDQSLKTSALHHGLAKALGVNSFDIWRNSEQDIVHFLMKNGMNTPTDLIRWSRAPSRLSARELSDRLFNSGLPIPKKIFTGVGSKMFIAKGRGRIDMYQLAGRNLSSDEAELEWCEAHSNKIVLSLDREFDWDADSPDSVELTGRDLMLHAYRFDHLNFGFNLLGDNLISPMVRPPEFKLYNASEEELDFERRVFSIFCEEIERSDAGWQEVIPLPNNNNIIFLKGKNGEFDWVIRDQRDEAFSGNPYHPFLKSHELPIAMQVSSFEAHLYFRTGEWYERLEYNAESRHYADGGTAATWPGYQKLMMRELLATRRNYLPPSQPKGWGAENFVAHHLDGYNLMVSSPITINEFWRFFDKSDWRNDRVTRSRHLRNSLETDLAAVNLYDDDSLPASVTWFDAVAFCKYYEDKTGLPVRLLEVEEWKKICPSPIQDINKDGWGNLEWAVVGGDGKTGGETSHRYPERCSDGGFLCFGKELTWTQNSQGLPFLNVVDFGEWLAGYANGYAPAANSATGRALMTGPLERDRCPGHLTMRYKGLKVGFRLCYVAHLNA